MQGERLRFAGLVNRRGIQDIGVKSPLAEIRRRRRAPDEPLGERDTWEEQEEFEKYR